MCTHPCVIFTVFDRVYLRHVTTYGRLRYIILLPVCSTTETPVHVCIQCFVVLDLWSLKIAVQICAKIEWTHDHNSNMDLCCHVSVLSDWRARRDTHTHVSNVDVASVWHTENIANMGVCTHVCTPYSMCVVCTHVCTHPIVCTHQNFTVSRVTRVILIGLRWFNLVPIARVQGYRDICCVTYGHVIRIFYWSIKNIFEHTPISMWRLTSTLTCNIWIDSPGHGEHAGYSHTAEFTFGAELHAKV